MTLTPEMITKALADGHGFRYDSELRFFRSVGRKAALESLNAGDLEALDGIIGLDLTPHIAAVNANPYPQEEPVKPADDASAEDKAAYDTAKAAYDLALSKARAAYQPYRSALDAKETATEKANKIRAYQNAATESPCVVDGAKAVLMQDLHRFIDQIPGSCAQCEGVLEAFIDANPGACIVKVRDGNDRVLCTDEGVEIIRASISVTTG